MFEMQRLRNSSVQRYLAVVLMCALASCTTTASYTDSALDAAIDDLRPGDQVSLYTVQGQVYKVIVERVSADSILSKNRSVDRQDIDRIEVTKRSAGKTTAAVVGGTLVAIVAIFGAFMAYVLYVYDDDD